MENYWETLKEWYSLIHSDKVDDAKKIFTKVYEELSKCDFENDENAKNNYISCLLWLWEINMKSWDFDKSLEYYILWNDLTKWTDFNVLFNLWVVYRNLWKEEESAEILEQAKKIEPNNANLIRFLWENDNNDDDSVNNWDNFNPGFEEKIQNMIKNINN